MAEKTPPDAAAVEAIVRALEAGNDRSNRVRDGAELVARLAEDGQRFDNSVLFAALASLIGEGRVEQRRGFGIWLSNGIKVQRVGGGDPTDLSKIDGPSWVLFRGHREIPREIAALFTAPIGRSS